MCLDKVCRSKRDRNRVGGWGGVRVVLGESLFRDHNGRIQRHTKDQRLDGEGPYR